MLTKSGYALRRLMEPAQEPVTLEETKTVLRIDSGMSDHDTMISGLISAARELAEAYTRRTFCETTWRLTLDGFPPFAPSDPIWQYWNAGRDVVELPRPPLREVTAVRYVNTDGTSTTMDEDDYLVDDASEPARVAPAYSTTWPSYRDQIGAVSFDFIAGYAPSADSPTDFAANVPQSVKQAILFAVKTWYWDCDGCAQASLPGVSQSLLNPLRVHTF